MTYPSDEMTSHPPISVNNFSKHVDHLKAEDDEKFKLEFDVSNFYYVPD